jgi:hypothetical protein
MEIFDVERSHGLRRLTGSRVSGTVAIRQALIDRVVGGWRRPALVEDTEVRLLAGDRVYVSAHIKVFGFRQHVEATLKLPTAVEFNERPTVRLPFIERSALARAATFAAPVLGRLPPGISLTDSAVTIDLAEILSRAGAADWLPHMKALAIETDDGVAWLNVAVEIAASGEVPRSTPRSGPTLASHGDSERTIGEVIRLLAGTRLAIALRAHESLVTETIHAALADVAQRTDRPHSTSAADIVRFFAPPRIRFEPETMVLETELRIEPALS